jgi:S1-C subfamily serine protease
LRAVLVSLCLFSFAIHCQAEEKRLDAPAQRGFMGILFEVNDASAQVTEVLPGGPAERAGIQAGDVVVKIGKTEIKSESDLRNAVGRSKPGDKIDVVIKRGEKEQTIQVTLGKMDDD